MNAPFDPSAILRTLARHQVRFILVGGLSGTYWGSPTITMDLDICYERDRANYTALANALRELKATLRGAPPGLPFQLDARTLELGDSFTFNTPFGPFDCLGTPSGTGGFTDLARSASELTVDEETRVLVCSLDDLMRMKRAAGRAKDRIELEILAAVKEEREKLR